MLVELSVMLDDVELTLSTGDCVTDLLGSLGGPMCARFSRRPPVANWQTCNAVKL